MSVKTRIYLAAALGEAPAMRALASRIRAAGYEVVSTWHDDVKDGATDPHNEALRVVVLSVNLLQIHRAHLVLVDTPRGEPCATYGEIGYALGIDTPVLWLQPLAKRNDNVRYTNVFDVHPLVAVVHSEADAFSVLKSIDDDIDSPLMTSLLPLGKAS